MAEVLTCLSYDFQPSQIILTGPGKWWMGKKDETSFSSTSSGAITLRAMFADSISDLQDIVNRISPCSIRSSSDFLRVDTGVIGLRWAPIGIPSRFGLNSEDPNDLQVLTYLYLKLNILNEIHAFTFCSEQ